MKIIFDIDVALQLMTLTTMIHCEFSGLGKVERRGDDFVITEFAPMAYGTEGFTEIPAPKLLSIISRPDAGQWRAWIHQHPMGPGVPGPQNWSGMDENTIRTNPLGGVPELVKWSISVVRTPHGWVGRLDTYVNPHTEHLEVTPNLQPALEPIVAQMQSDWVKDQPRHYGAWRTVEPQEPRVITRPPSRTSTQGNFFSRFFGRKRVQMVACADCFTAVDVDDVDENGLCPDCQPAIAPMCEMCGEDASGFNRHGTLLCKECLQDEMDAMREEGWYGS